MVRDQEWFEEIDLDPDQTWRRMGTRQLGERPWLVPDDRMAAELALKARLLEERHAEVFAVGPGLEAAGAETLALIEAELRRLDRPAPAGSVEGGTALHPLDRAGRLVQEDLCLMRREPQGWVLAGASLCFPSRWRLADKLGLHVTEVHQPVDGYGAELASRVDSLFDRLDQQIVWRRNWFIHADPALFQPDRPVGGEPVVLAERCSTDLHLRSERQTLRRLPATGCILFTIRTQQDPLGPFLDDAGRRSRLAHYLDRAPADQLSHRGLAPAQVTELRAAIAG